MAYVAREIITAIARARFSRYGITRNMRLWRDEIAQIEHVMGRQMTPAEREETEHQFLVEMNYESLARTC